MSHNSQYPSESGVSRRQLIRATAAGAGTLWLGAGIGRTTRAAEAAAAAQPEIPPEDYRATGGRIRHSVMAWCFADVPTPQLIQACARMGLSAMEGIGAEHYPAIKEAGMGVSLTGSHGFTKGPLDPDNREMCLAKLREGIDLAAEVGAPGVITFTGMRKQGVSDKQAEANCVECWKQVIDYAEEKQVNLCLEHLNTRDDTHRMKGHPGYFGDDVDLCIDLIKRVDSPRMKLLFDIYHVQIMNGDVIRRIRQHKDYIGHVHTAGVPGRGELDDSQEVNYPAVMRALVDVGYQGYVAHEFIPTWKDQLGALRHGVKVCDV
ncbi:MAG: hydroxypyruvate isomerase family protein [Planctomycetota bacterium]